MKKAALIFILLSITPQLALSKDVTVPVIQPPAGFDEGTETRLASNQVDEILPWATNSKIQLKDLLESGVDVNEKFDETVSRPHAEMTPLALATALNKLYAVQVCWHYLL